MSGGGHFSSASGALAPESTSSSLIERVRANSPEAWRKLVAIYTPLIYRWCRQLGVPPSDVPDVAQEVFRAVARQVPQLCTDQPGNSFRGWLYTVTRNKARDGFRRSKGRPEAVGGTDMQILLADVAEPSTDSVVESCQVDSGQAGGDEKLLVVQVLSHLRGEFSEATMTAFWRTIVDGHCAADIARDMGMNEKAVRQAKYRVLARLRDELKGLEG
ncbi:MAG TPA: sigma-70 family RNA polymerase sigma factor [Pirellulales bacterium]|jgi:RNA polymerase sigma-70 factor (ECF subfamily)|nr:sigma-70 family RNA polymerase sigma factor [Pirellulales bacterium]